MTDRFTAKVKVASRGEEAGQSHVTVVFGPDYEQGRNQDWAESTPTLSLQMRVKPELAASLSNGDTFTLTFEREVR